MPDRTLPSFPDLDQYRKQAKELVRDTCVGKQDAQARIRKHHPHLRNFDSKQPRILTLAAAQWVLAREHGYPSWASFAKHIETLRILRSVEELDDPHGTFLKVACVDRHGWHASGSLEHAEMLLARYPEVATESIFSGAVLADEALVHKWIKQDPSPAVAKGGPHKWDPLTYLCFSRYLRIEKARSASFVACARALLEAGANANTGWIDYIDDPPPTCS